MAAGDIVPVSGAQFEETLASAGPDVLREMIRQFAQRMMDAEVEVACNAGDGEVTPDRVNSRNGYRRREWDTRAGTIELAIPKLRQGSYFPCFLEHRRRVAPAPGRGGQAVVHRCDCRPGMTSCHQIARPAQKGQSRSRHRGCLLADTPAGGHPPRRRDPVPGPTVGDPELAGHLAGAGGPGGAHRDDLGRPVHVSARPPCR